MLRAFVGSPSQLTSFALTKDLLKTNEFFIQHSVLSSFVASIVGGIFQTACMTPFDLVSTRLFNQGKLSAFYCALALFVYMILCYKHIQFDLFILIKIVMDFDLPLMKITVEAPDLFKTSQV